MLVPGTPSAYSHLHLSPSKLTPKQPALDDDTERTGAADEGHSTGKRREFWSFRERHLLVMFVGCSGSSSEQNPRVINVYYVYVTYRYRDTDRPRCAYPSACLWGPQEWGVGAELSAGPCSTPLSTPGTQAPCTGMNLKSKRHREGMGRCG